jgi:pyrroloquinoline-quinone synthase
VTEYATSPDERTASPDEEFIARLRAQGERYHNLHPFHRRMDAGALTREELQRWVANRFYYQKCIPLKDAAIMANCPEVEVRRVWVQRILDHDGTADGTGGTESWLRLGEALGVSRGELTSERRVLPAVRYAVDAYVNFARQKPWIEAVASSLTELFGPAAMRVRLEALGVSRGELTSERRVLPAVRYAVDAYVNFARQKPWIEAVASSLTELFGPAAMRARLEALGRHYPWIDPAGLEYFRTRLVQAPRDAQYALDLTVEHCRTRAQQDAAVAALRFKTEVLWVQLDAIERGDTQPPGPVA